jgi:hypothetical protein
MTNDDPPIWPPYEICYLVSMRFLTESALRSINAVSSEIERTQGDFSDGNQDETLNHLQNIVGMGAALSRYFWPSRSVHEGRGKLLRQRFKITEASSLRMRELRNAIEHFDERLDAYLSKGIAGVIIPHYIGCSLKSDGIPGHLFRAYYVDTGEFEVLGQRFHIPPLVEEIKRINQLLHYSEKTGGRLPQD